MNEKDFDNKGLPAFPISGEPAMVRMRHDSYPGLGLSKREYIATQLLAGCIARVGSVHAEDVKGELIDRCLILTDELLKKV